MYSIYIADDEDLIRDSLVSHIAWEKIGFRVVGNADNGKEVLDYLKKNEVDVVLTDIKMPFASGIDIARLVFESRLDTRVVFLSGYKEFELARSAIEYGVKSYLLKPTRLDEVYKTFHTIKLELDEEAQRQRDKAEMEKQYNEAMLALKEQALTDLLFLKSKDSNYEVLNKYGIHLNGRNFCVGIIEIINYNNVVEKKWHYGSDLLMVALGNIISKTAGIDVNCYTVQLEDNKLCVILNSDAVEKLIESEAIIQSNIMDLLSIQVSIKMSNVFSKVEEIHDFFRQLQYENVGVNPTYPVSNEMKSSHGEIEYPIAKERLLLSFLNLCEEEKVNAMLDELFDIPDIGSNNKEDINMYCSEFLVGLSRFLIEIRTTLRDITGACIHPQMDFTSLGTVEDIKLWFKQICIQIMEYILSNRECADKKVVNIIKEYINSNLDKDISLTIIADKVYLNPVYLSKFFKKQTGENFIDYLIRIRMEKAKELLEDVTLKIGEVGERVGYRNPKHFFKTFKRYTGSKPSEYRDKIPKIT